MTSGEFAVFPINLIHVSAERQRKRFDDIESLASSIARNGLIHPIVIRRDGELVAGERRLLAHRQLGRTEIQVQFLDELSREEAYLIELEENLRRRNLTWQEECHAASAYHSMRVASDPEWGLKHSAEELCISQQSISDYIRVAEYLRRGDEDIVNADKFSVARGIVTRRTDREKQVAMADALTLAPAMPTTTATAVSDAASADEALSAMADIGIDGASPVPIINADFREWADAYSEPTRYNFIHCDFPYGIQMNRADQGAADKLGGYEDSEDIYWELVHHFLARQNRFVADEAHCMFWFSMRYYQRTKDLFEECGWRVNYMPLIWAKSDNAGALPDPSRGPRQTYETAFLMTKGDRKIARAVSNVYWGPTTKRFHMSEKSLDMLQHFFRMLVDKTTLMLDPTCGSGNAIRAGKAAAARLGIERDPEFYERRASLRQLARGVRG